LGHEFSGVVEEIGADVKDIKVGDRVAVYPMILNGVKPPNEDMFDGFSTVGLHIDGGFADYTIVSEGSLYKLPENLSLNEGALIEPAAVAVQALKEANIKIGDSVAVFGAGPIGLLTILAAKAAGATNIISLDLSETRLELAKKVGATHIINSGNVDPVEAIKEILPNGVDVAFEVAGVEPTFKQAIQSSKIRGKVIVISIFSKPISWNPLEIQTTGVTLASSFAYEPETFKQTIDLIASGQLNAKEVITDKIALEEIVENGFKALTEDKSQAKILVELSGEK